MTFVCQVCGKEHEEWPPDIGFQRPDEVWAIPEDERAKRSRSGNDLCILDEERFFVRCILYVPLVERGKNWGLGLWIEVSRQDFERYYNVYDVDASREPPLGGRIANALRAFPAALGSEVQAWLGTTKDRPVLKYAPESEIDLARAQAQGLTDVALHEVTAVERPTWFAAAEGV